MLLISHDALARSRMAKAEIHSVKGLPCFTISEKEERRNGQPYLGALIVSDLTDKPVSEVWGFLMTGGKKVLLTSKSCLLYGNLPPGAYGLPAPALKTGHVYEVFLNGRPKDGSDPTYGYAGKFCVADSMNGMQKIIPVTREMQAWIDETCPVSSPSK